MIDRISENFAGNPLIFALGVLCWIPVVVWILSMVNWMITGDVDVLSGFLGICVGFGLGYLALAPPAPIITIIVFCTTLGTVVLYPTMKNVFESRALAAIDIEGVQNAYRQLGERGDNVGARIKLAKLLWSRGLHGQAITIAENTIRGLPTNVFEEENRMISRWKGSVGDKVARSMPCLECGTPNEPGLIYCKKCKAPFLLHYAKGKWIGPNLGKRLLAGWLASMLVLVGLPVCASTLKPMPMAAVMLALCILAGVVLFVGFKGTTEHRTQA